MAEHSTNLVVEPCSQNSGTRERCEARSQPSRRATPYSASGRTGRARDVRRPFEDVFRRLPQRRLELAWYSDLSSQCPKLTARSKRGSLGPPSSRLSEPHS